MEQFIKFDCTRDFFDYTYTYDISNLKRHQIISKMGVINPNDSMCLLNPSGTNTIMNILYFLKIHGFKKVGVLNPSYFSVEYGCKTYNIKCEKIPMAYINGRYKIPLDRILQNHFDVIWLTSPAYSTGISYDESDIKDIQQIILNKILVIADETLAMQEQTLLSKIPISDYFYSIYCPHKPLFINKIKFSALICPKKNDDFLEQWIDVISGGLLHSNIIAIEHFLSENFLDCVHAAKRWYRNSLEMIKEVVLEFPCVVYNLDEISPYKTIYFKMPSKRIDDINNIRDLSNNEYVWLIISLCEMTKRFKAA